MNPFSLPSALKSLFIMFLITASFSFFCQRSHALDKRLRLAFKTAGYGAGAGFVVGAGTIALGLGGIRNAFMGASAGLYAGIALAAYIIAVPEVDPRRYKRPRAPYPRQRPVGPDDWENEPEENYKDYLPGRESRFKQSEGVISGALSEWAIKANLLTLDF